MQLDESEKTIYRLLTELEKMVTVSAYAEHATALMVDRLSSDEQRAFLLWFLVSPKALTDQLNQIDRGTTGRLARTFPNEAERTKVLQKAVLAKLRSRFGLTSFVRIAQEAASLKWKT